MFLVLIDHNLSSELK